MTSETSQLLRTAGVLILGVGAAFGGMIARERVSLISNDSTLNSLVASKDGEPIPEDDYFTELAKLIEQDYVDPISDEMKLATGAVRGMVGSLRDLNSIFYEKDDFVVVQRALNGKYEGIGADLAFQYPSAKPTDEEQQIPRVVVLSVVPNGPAAKAGVQPGDWVDTVDGRWVINTLFLDQARAIQKKVQNKQLPQSAFDAVRKELRTKLDDSIPPMRAWKRLMIGKDGTVKVRFYRGDQPRDATMQRSSTERVSSTSARRLTFAPGSAKRFEVPSGPIVIDLRGSVGGDFQTALDILGKLGVGGKLGDLKRTGRSTTPVALKMKSESATNATILVDKQTRGTAEIFAMAMKRAGAKVDGISAGAPIATEVALLPDGSGFTLNLGTFVGGAK